MNLPTRDWPLEHEWDRASVAFDLTPDSVVMELGGYEGRWAHHMSTRNKPKVFAFEPQDWAYQILRQTLYPLENATALNFGLGVENGMFPMSDWGTDGCSFVKPAGDRPTGTGEMREITSWLESESIEEIDVMLMNVEGYEFILIPYMLRKGLLPRIKHFMCQFHPDSESGMMMYRSLRRRLSEHRLTRFDYGPTLICWDRL